MIRALHLSDVHVHEGLGRAPLGGFLNKRLLGVANLLARRRRLFRDAPAKLAALAELVARESVDLVLVTGDLTALGTEPELAAARACLEPFRKAPLGLVVIPGNHDVYVPDAVADGRWARHLGDLCGTDLPDLAVDGRWPAVRLLEPDLAVVSVDSARPNPQPWRSSGRIPDAQIGGLRRALADPRVRERFVLVLTHYAPRRPDDTPDTRLHGLENADALLGACAAVRRGALLHGHIHWRFALPRRADRLPIFGAGSSTCEGREGFWLLELDAAGARALPGSLQRSGAAYRCTFDPRAAVAIEAAGGPY